MTWRIIKKPEALEVLGVGNTTFYKLIKDGLMTQGVEQGAHSRGWPDYEVQAIAAAIIAGQSDDEIRALVKQLIEHRKNLPANMQAMLSHHQSKESESPTHYAARGFARRSDELASIEMGGNANEQ
jgi:prophage regulatory protein